MFWRIYFHGFVILLVVGFTLAMMARTFVRRGPWMDMPRRAERMISHEFARCQGDPVCLKDELEIHGEITGIQGTLYRLDGEVIASTSAQVPPPLPLHEARHLTGRQEWDHSHWKLLVPIRQRGQIVGYGMLTSEDDNSRSILKGLLILTGVLAALAIVSVPLARTLVAPLDRLRRTAEAFGAGDLSARTGLPRSGEVGQLAGAFDDMAARLEGLIRGQRELLANVSHELRTPLARIRFALEMAETGDEEEARRLLAEMGTDVTELERLVEDVLNSARLELGEGGGGLVLRKEPLSAADLLSKAEERFRHRHGDRELCTQWGDLPAVMGDATWLRRMVDNLLENAVRHGADPITLAAHQAASNLIVEVRDQGPGIPPEDLPHLFEPFFRSDRSRTRDTGGVGLGLTLVRRIATHHGGDVQVSSSPAEGTVFRVHLPVLDEKV